MNDILQQILYFFGHGFCHQYTERSFEAGGLYFCVCARDTGIYLGLIVTLLILIILSARNREKPAALPPVWAIAVCVVLAVPMAIDGVSSYAGLRETTNLIRYVTGYLCGTGVGVVAGGAVMSLWARANHNLSAVRSPGRLILVLVASVAAGTLFYLTYAALGVIAPFMILGCLWLAIVLINVLIVSTTRFWRHKGDVSLLSAEDKTETSPLCLNTSPLCLVLLCFLAALVEMALLSLIVSALGILFPWYVHP